MNGRITIFLLVLLCLAPASTARADRITVAVAANFSGTAQQLSDAFERLSGHTVVLVSGSTGRHFAQVGGNTSDG